MSLDMIRDIPAHDPAFEIAVLTRIEQRRYARGLAANAALGVAATLLLALVLPHLDLNMTRDFASAFAVTALLALTLSLQWGLMRRA